jgi:hypothetical protein
MSEDVVPRKGVRRVGRFVTDLVWEGSVEVWKSIGFAAALGLGGSYLAIFGAGVALAAILNPAWIVAALLLIFFLIALIGGYRVWNDAERKAFDEGEKRKELEAQPRGGPNISIHGSTIRETHGDVFRIGNGLTPQQVQERIDNAVRQAVVSVLAKQWAAGSPTREAEIQRGYMSDELLAHLNAELSRLGWDFQVTRENPEEGEPIRSSGEGQCLRSDPVEGATEPGEDGEVGMEGHPVDAPDAEREE